MTEKQQSHVDKLLTGLDKWRKTKPDTVIITVKVPENIASFYERYAAKAGLTRNQVVKMFVIQNAVTEEGK